MWGKISIHHAASVSDAKFNKITARPLPTHRKKNDAKDKKKGIFHLLSTEIRETIITVAIEDTPVARSKNNPGPERVEKAKLDRERFLVKKKLDKSKKSLVKAMMYHEIYNSETCWKCDYKIVTANIIKLDSKAKRGKS